MKKNLLLGFLVLFLLSTTAFAGVNDPKKGSERPAVSNTEEKRLSGEELSRLTRRVEMDNLTKKNLLNKENNSSAKNLKAAKQVEVGSRHGRTIWLSGGAILLIIILVILLV